jgi:tetratricopeptide (TPR) repeat protein
MQFRGILVISIVCGLALAVAHADNKQLARDAYRDGTRLYDLADYQGALEQFKKAYFNYEEPAFLYNIAQCYRQLGNKPEAIRFYKTFLRKLPDSPHSEEVRRLVTTLTAEMTAEKPAPTPQPLVTPAEGPNAPSASPPAPAVALVPAATPAPVDLVAQPVRRRQPAYKKWWVWTLTGVAAAAAASAIAVGIVLSQRTETTYAPVPVP